MKLFVTTLSIFLFTYVSAQDTASINRFMQYCQTNFRFQGTVLVADANHLIYLRSFGKANEEKNEPIKDNTRFRLGSISKQFTAFIILQLAREKKISLDDKLGKYLPAFNRLDKQDITIRNLLTHTSGLPDYTEMGRFNDANYYTKDSIIHLISSELNAFNPSTNYTYCNSNFFLLAVIIEKVTGKPYKGVLQEKILSPANMMNSGEEESDPISQEAKGYVLQNDAIMPASFIEMRNTEGGGGMYSMAEDMNRWSRFFQQKLASDTLFKNAIKPFVVQEGSSTMYSSGWCLFPDIIFHNGHINGFSNCIAIDTVHHLTIVILSNHDYRQLFITLQTLKNFSLNNPKAGSWINMPSTVNLADYRGDYTVDQLTVHVKDSLPYLRSEVSGVKQTFRWCGQDEFFCLEQEQFIHFERNDKGVVTGLKSLNDYVWVPVKKQ